MNGNSREPVEQKVDFTFAHAWFHLWKTLGWHRKLQRQWAAQKCKNTHKHTPQTLTCYLSSQHVSWVTPIHIWCHHFQIILPSCLFTITHKQQPFGCPPPQENLRSSSWYSHTHFVAFRDFNHSHVKTAPLYVSHFVSLMKSSHAPHKPYGFYCVI